MIDIRQLTSIDLPVMHGMLSVFGAAFEDPESYDMNRPGDAYLARLLGSDSFIAIAAVEDDSVVGGIAAYELRKFEQERSEIYLYDLAVAESHRRRGIARALIAELQTIAATRNASVVFVQAVVGDDPAIALYGSLGTREEVFHFDLPTLPTRLV